MQVLMLMAIAGLLGLFLRWPAWLALAMLAGGLGLLAFAFASRLFDLMSGPGDTSGAATLGRHDRRAYSAGSTRR
jgi:hypothetical protein